MTRSSSPHPFFDWMAKHPRKADCILFVALLVWAAFFRMVYLVELAQTSVGTVAVGPDVAEYDLWARQILTGGGLWDSIPNHGPLYPLFLAFVYRLGRGSVLFARGVQLFGLDLFSLGLVWFAGRRIWNRRVAFAAVFVWSIYAPIIFFTAELFSEGLALFCISAAIFSWSFVLRGEKEGLRRIAAGATAILLGLASISHSLTLPFSFLFVCLAPFLSKVGKSRGDTLRLSLLMLALLFVPILPVTMKNYSISQQFVLIQGRAGLNLYIGNNPDANGTPNVPPGREFDRLVEWPQREGISAEKEKTRFFQKKALDFAVHHPGRQVKLWLQKFLLTWNRQEIPSGSDLPELYYLTPFMRLRFLPRFGILGSLALAGFWLARKDRKLWGLLLLPAIYTLVLTLFVTCGRYRLPMLPVLFLGAGLAVDALIEAWACRDERVWRDATVAILLGLFLTFLPKPPAIADSASRSQMMFAEAAWKNGNPVLALKAVEETLAVDAEHAAAYHLRGILLGARGKTAAARQALEHSLRLNPDNLQAVVDLAILLSETGQRDLAYTILRNFVEKNPSSASGWYNLGVLEEAGGNLEQAQTAYRRAIAANSAFASAWLNLGMIAARGNRFEQAMEAFDRAVIADPRKARAYVGIAVVHLARGKVREGFRAFEQALQLEPLRADVWQTYARAALDCGYPDLSADIKKRAALTLAPLAAAEKTELPPGEAPPDTAPPDTAPPDTAPPDTAPPDTAPAGNHSKEEKTP